MGAREFGALSMQLCRFDPKTMSIVPEEDRNDGGWKLVGGKLKSRFWGLGELMGKEAGGSSGQVLKGKLLNTDQRKTE